MVESVAKIPAEVVTRNDVEKLPNLGRQYSVAVGGRLRVPGLRLAVTACGRKSYTLAFTYKGRERRPKLGEHPHMSPESARSKALAWRASAEAGNDPRPAPEEVKIGDTMREAAALFVTRYCIARGRRSCREVERVFREHVCGTARGVGKNCCDRHHIGEMPISEVRRSHLLPILDHVAEHHGQDSARVAYAFLNRFFRWAASRGMTDDLPTALIERPPQSRPRTRTLADQEVALLWRASATLPTPYAQFVKLLLVLGLRRTEAASIEHAEIDRERRLLTLSAAKMKNGLAHTLPLTDLAMEIIDSLPIVSGNDYLLASLHKRGAHVNSYDTIKKWLDARVRAAQLAAHPGADPSTVKPLAPWCLHDCRRTVRSGLSLLGVQPQVAELLLAHKLTGIRAVYDKYEFLKEKREAMAQWSAHLQSIVSAPPTLRAVA